MSKTNQLPKILLLDIETAPILSYVWGLWNNNVGLNQIAADWHILSWSAKWLGQDKIFYHDQKYMKKNTQDDKNILAILHELLNKADIVITHNGKNFDEKRLNARFIYHGMQPTSHYKHIDTYRIAKKRFGFTSNKLEYLAEHLNVPIKKFSKKRKFSGFELWSECLKGNRYAWKEMKTYNITDILVLEEVYKRLSAWDNSIDFNVYHNHLTNKCNCGSTEFKKSGFYYTNNGKYQRYKCVECGHETRDRRNLLTREKRDNLRKLTA